MSFDIEKPTVINALFKKYNSHSPIDFLQLQAMKKLKWDLENGYIEARIKALNLLPINKKQFATIKGQITRKYKKDKHRLNDYEIKYGVIDDESPQKEFSFYKVDI